MNSNKTFLILGASSDLGLALFKKLNDQYENSVFCLHYNSSDASLKELELKDGNTARLIKADFTSDEEVGSLIKTLKDEDLIPTHIVHLPADKLHYTRLKDYDQEHLERNLKIQVYSFVQILKAFLPAMVKRKDHNKVVAVLSSVVLGKPPRSMLEYTMVKSMLHGVIRQLAADNEGKLININSVSPSMIETRLLSEIDPRIIEMAAGESPESRNATVDDVVPSICFLLSEDSNYLNGVNINISNGNVII